MTEQQLFLEHELIRQAQSGNSAAYGELYTHHLAAIQHYIKKRVGERADAEDLTQTVFVKAWQALRDYQPSGAPFRAWLYRIAHNAIVDHYRTQRQALFWDDLTWLVDPRETPETHSLQRERQESVRKAVAGLRKNYQTVVEQRFLQELDYGETAEALGQQVNHVRVVQHRALEVLRRVLSQDNVLWVATAVTVLSLLLGGKIVVAAEQALPGERLYPMRTWVEETRLFLADDADDVELHTRFATQRIKALAQLSQQGRTADLTTAITAAAAHLRAASAQFVTVQAVERATLAPQWAAALQSQVATLQDLTQADPQTVNTLQPVLLAVTAAQATLQDTASPAPTLTSTPTLQPTATRLLLPTAPPVVVVPSAKLGGDDAAKPLATPVTFITATTTTVTPTAVGEAQHAEQTRRSHPNATAAAQPTVESTPPTPPPSNAPAQRESASPADHHTASATNEQAKPEHDNTVAASTTHETSATPLPDIPVAAGGATDHEQAEGRPEHHDANDEAHPSTTTEATDQSRPTAAPEQSAGDDAVSPKPPQGPRR